MPNKLNYPTNLKDYSHWLIKQLKEYSKGVHAQIFRLVEVAGVERTQEIYLQTLEIEANGGLKTNDGSNRRRTIGGAFLYLAKLKLSDDEVHKIFFKFSSDTRYQRDRTMDWSDRFDAINSIEMQGEIHEMKVTLTGQPGDITKIGNTIILQMHHKFDYDFLNYPIGTPEATLPPTVYTVYIAEKEWEKVEKKLQNPRMVLHVNGDCHIDPLTQSIAVFARHAKVQQDKKLNGKSATESAKATTVKEVKEPQLSKQQSQNRNSKAPTSTDSKATDACIETTQPLNLPDSVPDDVATKAQDMHTAICKFEEKIAKLKSSNQRSGIAMTQRLLENTKTQLEVLLKPYR